jgi:hypothetical protein
MAIAGAIPTIRCTGINATQRDETEQTSIIRDHQE